MAKLVIETMVAIPFFLLWMTAVAVVVRPFGVRLPLMPFGFAKRRAAIQTLTFSQHLIVVGVLLFGCGLWIIWTFVRYLEWKYWQGPAITGEVVWRDVIQFPFVSGLIFGLFSATSKG